MKLLWERGSREEKRERERERERSEKGHDRIWLHSATSVSVIAH